MFFTQLSLSLQPKINNRYKEVRKIQICDITMKQSDMDGGSSLSFRQKIELAKLLNKLGVSIIEVGPIINGKRDSLLIKSLATAVGNSILSVPVDIFREGNIDETWDALKEAKHPRLQISLPVSTVQMEYICHKKPDAMLNALRAAVIKCKSICSDIEFVAADFGRADREFAKDMICAAIESGATTITIYDTAGILFGHEIYESIDWERKIIPSNVKLGVWCSNRLFAADYTAMAAVGAGADEVKTVCFGSTTTSLKRFATILDARSDLSQAYCEVKMTELQRAISQIKLLCQSEKKNSFAALDGTRNDNNIQLTIHDDIQQVINATAKLGYDLNEEDAQKVFDAFVVLAQKSEVIEAKELDAIVASVAFQVPPTYHLESYQITSGNIISASCHIRLRKEQEILESVCLGDGPIDAAFQAIEKLVGMKYELDDFQIQSVTGGRGAMGGATVRLRHNGQVTPGRGTSTDIVEASILAYLNALNKIVFEE